ncbi:MAG: hypothetical protein AVDCRST_MAG11-2009, partial [uncultured Gemmatimonadaceae bacterium]
GSAEGTRGAVARDGAGGGARGGAARGAGVRRRVARGVPVAGAL